MKRERGRGRGRGSRPIALTSPFCSTANGQGKVSGKVRGVWHRPKRAGWNHRSGTAVRIFRQKRACWHAKSCNVALVHIEGSGTHFAAQSGPAGLRRPWSCTETRHTSGREKGGGQIDQVFPSCCCGEWLPPVWFSGESITWFSGHGRRCSGPYTSTRPRIFVAA
jgi:hypothetical protein